MNAKAIRMSILLSAFALLAGCGGIQHQLVRVDAPPGIVAPSGAPAIVIGTITDARPAATELQLGMADEAGNVGGFGHGNRGIAVDLASGSVTDTMRRIIASALQNSGYRVVGDAAGAQRVDVRITQFQVITPMHFWRTVFYNQRMVADVSAHITITTPTGARTFTASGHGYNVFQRMVADNWKIALDKAVADFSNNLRAQISAAK